MFKLDLEKAEEPEIELLTSAGSQKRQDNFRKTSASLSTLNPLTVDHNKLWKNLKGGENQTTLPASSEAWMQVKKQQLETNMEQWMDWFKIGKGVCQGYVLSLCLFNLYAKYIKRNAGLDDGQAGIRSAGRNIINFRYTDDTTLIAESKGELESLLMRVKEESEKAGD